MATGILARGRLAGGAGMAGGGGLQADGERDPPRLGVFAISHAGAKAMPPRA